MRRRFSQGLPSPRPSPASGRGCLGIAALLVLASAPARAASPSDIVAATKKIDGLYDSWRFGEADAALAALRKSAPAAPEVSYLDGYSRFMHGDYDGAARALTGAA